MASKFFIETQKKPRTIIVVSNALLKSAKKKDILSYEKELRSKLLQYENDENFLIFFIHVKANQNIVKLFDNARIASAVLFMDDVSEPDVTFYIEHIFKKKNDCNFYFKGEVEVKYALSFSGEIEHFLPITKKELVLQN